MDVQTQILFGLLLFNNSFHAAKLLRSRKARKGKKEKKEKRYLSTIFVSKKKLSNIKNT